MNKSKESMICPDFSRDALICPYVCAALAINGRIYRRVTNFNNASLFFSGNELLESPYSSSANVMTEIPISLIRIDCIFLSTDSGFFLMR